MYTHISLTLTLTLSELYHLTTHTHLKEVRRKTKESTKCFKNSNLQEKRRIKVDNQLRRLGNSTAKIYRIEI